MMTMFIGTETLVTKLVNERPIECMQTGMLATGQKIQTFYRMTLEHGSSLIRVCVPLL
jgi:hypothetical protein